MRAHTVHTRDAALRQLRRVNRWMVAGSVALTGVLSAVAANAFPGKTLHASQGKHGSRRPAGHTSTAPAKPLAPPAQAPEAATESAAPQQSPESASPGESASPQEPAPSQQGGESAPAQESPREEARPPAAAEATPEAAPPVVSGGS